MIIQRFQARLTQAPESDGVRAICAQWPQLTILEGLLYRKWHLKHDQTEEIFHFIAPKALRKELFLHLHSSRIGGHLGISKTIENVRRRFYWPGCKTDIRRWCQQCSSCAQIKPGPRSKAKLKQFTTSAPLDCVAIDLLGELPETNNGKQICISNH